jgi:hypothetical protein
MKDAKNIKRGIECTRESFEKNLKLTTFETIGSKDETVLNSISSTENIETTTTTTTTTSICSKCSKCKVINDIDSNASNSKKNKTEETNDKQDNTNKNKSDYNLNFPLGKQSDGDIACLVKVYDDDADDFKINSMVEFIGILSKDVSLAYQVDEHECHSMFHGHTFNDASTSENQPDHCKCDNMPKKAVLSSYPPSLVPRLHCIKFYSLVHNNPLLEKLTQKSDKYMEKEKASSVDKKVEINNYWREEFKKFSSLCLRSETSSFDDSIIHLHKLRQELLNCFQEMLLGRLTFQLSSSSSFFSNF